MVGILQYPSNFRSQYDIDTFLKQNNTPAYDMKTQYNRKTEISG